MTDVDSLKVNVRRNRPTTESQENFMLRVLLVIPCLLVVLVGHATAQTLNQCEAENAKLVEEVVRLRGELYRRKQMQRPTSGGYTRPTPSGYRRPLQQTNQTLRDLSEMQRHMERLTK